MKKNLIRIAMLMVITLSCFSTAIIIMGSDNDKSIPEIALAFDGTDDYVNCGSTGVISGMNQFTVEAWVKPAVSEEHRIIVSNFGSFGNSGGFQMITAGTPSYFGIMFRDQNYIDQYISSQTVIQPDTWYHVAGTCVDDGSGVLMALYVNGEMEDSFYFDGLQLNYDNISDLFIGSNIDGAPPGGVDDLREFHGIIDEVRIWETALTGPDFETLMFQTLTGTEDGLLACWTISAGSGQVVSDITDSGNDGQLGGSPESDNSDPSWTATEWPYLDYAGCMDPEACNFDELANMDDGSCSYPDCAGDCPPAAFIDECGECVEGSTGLQENWAMDFCGVCFGENDCPGNGDIDGDGDTTVLDVVISVDYVLGWADFDEYELWAADTIYDGTINIVDIVRLVAMILGDIIINP